MWLSILLGTTLSLRLALAVPPLAVREPERLFGELYREEKLRGDGMNWDIYQSQQQKVVAPEDDVSMFRFHTAQTAAFRVSSLPDVPHAVGEMYSGLMPVREGDPSRQLFYVFQPSINAPTDTLTVWLNGGPGCSSLEGFFQENGRYVWMEGDEKPTINQYSWVNLTNVLWVEQPIGTGFTVGQPVAKTQEETAADFVGFLKNFQKTYGIKNFKIYITGESYAGRYVPYIANAILDQKDKENFDLKGAMIVDGCIGHYNVVQQQVTAVPYVQYHYQHFNFTQQLMSQLEEIHQQCGYQQFIDRYMKFPPPGLQPRFPRNRMQCDVFNRITYQIRAKNPCFNIYDVGARCPKKADPMKGMIPYFNRPDVKASIHAPVAANWAMCSRRRIYNGPKGQGPEGEGDLSADPIEFVLPRVIEATNRVLVTNGEYDFIIQSNGTLLAIQNMTWNGALGFQKQPAAQIQIEGEGVRGVQHHERGLMWADSFKTGHMGPGMAPSVSWRHLQWLLGMVETL